MLDEECLTKGSDAKLIKKYNDTLSGRKGFSRPNKFNSNRFIINHYAGSVEYDITGFLEKNLDTVNDMIGQVMNTSGQGLLKKLY